MLITRETDYALRILRALSEGGCFTVGELAERESLPRNFAYKIVKKLEKAKFLCIARGIGGGCSLACDLQQVSLWELIDAMEAKARLSSCMISGYDCEWQRANGPCGIHVQLCRLQKEIDRELRSRSLYWVINGDQETVTDKRRAAAML